MSILSYSVAPSKGSTVTVTLDKVALLALDSVTSDPWWADDAGIVQAIVTLKTNPGKGKIVLQFDFTQDPCTAQLTLPQYTRDEFQIDKIVMIDTMGDKISLSRATLLADDPTITESEIFLNQLFAILYGSTFYAYDGQDIPIRIRDGEIGLLGKKEPRDSYLVEHKRVGTDDYYLLQTYNKYYNGMFAVQKNNTILFVVDLNDPDNGVDADYYSSNLGNTKMHIVGSDVYVKATRYVGGDAIYKNGTLEHVPPADASLRIASHGADIYYMESANPSSPSVVKIYKNGTLFYSIPNPANFQITHTDPLYSGQTWSYDASSASGHFPQDLVVSTSGDVYIISDVTGPALNHLGQATIFSASFISINGATPVLIENQWTTGYPLNQGRSFVWAALINSGKIYLAGSFNGFLGVLYAQVTSIFSNIITVSSESVDRFNNRIILKKNGSSTFCAKNWGGLDVYDAEQMDLGPAFSTPYEPGPGADFFTQDISIVAGQTKYYGSYYNGSHGIFAAASLSDPALASGPSLFLNRITLLNGLLPKATVAGGTPYRSRVQNGSEMIAVSRRSYGGNESPGYYKDGVYHSLSIDYGLEGRAAAVDVCLAGADVVACGDYTQFIAPTNTLEGQSRPCMWWNGVRHDLSDLNDPGTEVNKVHRIFPVSSTEVLIVGESFGQICTWQALSDGTTVKTTQLNAGAHQYAASQRLATGELVLLVKYNGQIPWLFIDDVQYPWAFPDAASGIFSDEGSLAVSGADVYVVYEKEAGGDVVVVKNNVIQHMITEPNRLVPCSPQIKIVGSDVYVAINISDAGIIKTAVYKNGTQLFVSADTESLSLSSEMQQALVTEYSPVFDPASFQKSDFEVK